MGHAIGIDLGTTNSVVAFLEGGRPVVIANAEGAKTTPSVVLYPGDGSEPIVGDLAKRQSLIQPANAIRSVKRLMGARLSELPEQVLRSLYQIDANEEGASVVVVNGKRLTPEQISAEILKKMVRSAEDFLGEDIDQAVITVPAYFNDSQRTATKRAGELAGLTVIRIINEPTAAALAYGLHRGEAEKIAVFDFGGGTFDISILDIDGDVFEVRSTNGDTFLGGDNLDMALSDYLCDAITAETGVDPRANAEARQRVHDAAERAKCELSSLNSTVVALPFIVSDASGPKHFNRTLTREEFEKLVDPILQRLAPPCRQALADARLRPADIANVILVGGSTRIPAVRRLAQEIFGREPSQAVNPDEAVALGAAIQAGVLTGALQEVLLLDITPLSLGIELQGGIFSPLIPRNSTIPTSASKTFTTVRDNQTSVRIHVLQGERRMASQNRTLARFRLEGIDPAPREIPEIAVTFAIDANGILNVTAQDLSSGRKQEVTVESYAESVSADDAERIVKQAEQQIDQDREFLALARIKTRARRHADTARAYLEKAGERLGEDDTRLIRERLFRLDAALSGMDTSAIDAAEADLRQLSEMFNDLNFLDRLI